MPGRIRPGLGAPRRPRPTPGRRPDEPPTNGPVVTWTFQQRLASRSMARITRALNDMKIPVCTRPNRCRPPVTAAANPTTAAPSRTWVLRARVCVSSVHRGAGVGTFLAGRPGGVSRGGPGVWAPRTATTAGSSGSPARPVRLVLVLVRGTGRLIRGAGRQPRAAKTNTKAAFTLIWIVGRGTPRDALAGAHRACYGPGDAGLKAPRRPRRLRIGVLDAKPRRDETRACGS